TPGVENCSTIGSNLQRCDPLAVVSGVVGDLASQEIRSRRDPGVVSAFIVENPSDDLNILGCVELRGKRPAHNLLNGKRLGEGRDGSEQQEEGGKFERSQVDLRVSAFQKSCMILAEVLYAKVSTTQNENDVAVRTKPILRAQGRGQCARSGRLRENLGAL